MNLTCSGHFCPDTKNDVTIQSNKNMQQQTAFHFFDFLNPVIHRKYKSCDILSNDNARYACQHTQNCRKCYAY